MTNPIIVTPRTRPEDLPQYLTVAELMAYMRLGRSTAYDLIRRGVVPAVRWGRVIRIPREALEKYISTEGPTTNGNADSVRKTKPASEN